MMITVGRELSTDFYFRNHSMFFLFLAILLLVDTTDTVVQASTPKCWVPGACPLPSCTSTPSPKGTKDRPALRFVAKLDYYILDAKTYNIYYVPAREAAYNISLWLNRLQPSIPISFCDFSYVQWDTPYGGDKVMNFSLVLPSTMSASDREIVDNTLMGLGKEYAATSTYLLPASSRIGIVSLFPQCEGNIHEPNYLTYYVSGGGGCRDDIFWRSCYMKFQLLPYLAPLGVPYCRMRVFCSGKCHSATLTIYVNGTQQLDDVQSWIDTKSVSSMGWTSIKLIASTRPAAIPPMLYNIGVLGISFGVLPIWLLVCWWGLKRDRLKKIQNTMQPSNDVCQMSPIQPTQRSADAEYNIRTSSHADMPPMHTQFQPQKQTKPRKHQFGGNATATATHESHQQIQTMNCSELANFLRSKNVSEPVLNLIQTEQYGGQEFVDPAFVELALEGDDEMCALYSVKPLHIKTLKRIHDEVVGK